MKLTTPTEHAIYGAAYVRRLWAELGVARPEDFPPEEWDARATDLAIVAAEHAVKLHREAVRRRRSS